MAASDRFNLLSQRKRVLVTASNRQARFWTEQYHQKQSQTSGVWTAPDILPLETWLSRTYARLAQLKTMPTCLTPSQCLWLWEDIIRNSPQAEYLISTRATARKVQEAFQLLNQWRVSLTQIDPVTEDHEAFVNWATSYQSRLDDKQWLDSSQLIDHLLIGLADEVLVEQLRLTPQMEWLGFHQVTPQQQTLIERLAQLGIETLNANEPEPDQTQNCQGVVCDSFEQEIHSAAEWLKQAVTENPHGRYALIIPDLDKRRFQVSNLLQQQLHPETLHLPEPPATVYNLSVGEGLTQLPFCRVALAVLGLLGRSIETEQFIEALRSPQVSLWDEFKAEARHLSFHLVERPQDHWRIEQIRSLLMNQFRQREAQSEHCESRIENLSQKFDALIVLQQQAKGQQSPEQWALLFRQWLELFGWPGSSTLSSRQYQLRDQILSHLQQLRQFNRLTSECGFQQAYQWLLEMLEGQTFQEKSAGEPIQVMGLYEAVGLRFDGVWLSGFSNEVMPEVASPNPFIPIAMARHHHLPGSGPERELEFAESLVQALLASSEQVTISYYRLDNDRELSVSPLVVDAVSEWLPPPPFSPLVERIPRLEKDTFADDYGFSYPHEDLVGGSSFLQAQSLCPMQGYLGYRMRLLEQESAQPGIDPRDRGLFVHHVLQAIWLKLVDQQKLLGMSDDELIQLIDQEMDTVLTRHFNDSGLLKSLEKEKYSQLIFDLLIIEKKRHPFRVIGCEQETEIRLNDLNIKGRLDRIDDVEGIGHAIIDYKTGKVNVQKWFGDRIAEPQLPLYLLSDKEHIAALCFAQIHHEEVRFAGVSEKDDLFPKVTSIESSKSDIDDWPSFVSHMEQNLIEVTEQIKQGFAAVDPATELGACDYCPYDSICRVGELEPDLNQEDDA